MRTCILLSLNGPRTIATHPRVCGLVKTKKVVGRTGYLWCSTEYNPTNVWNVKGDTGVVNNNNNNNNKNNSNVVRAVCALDEKKKLLWIEAYKDCLRHKLSSMECCEYRIYGEEDVLILAYEAYSFTYTPSISKCFCVTRPRLREVFAANFRDRIVHHWICIRLEPLFERLFVSEGNLSYNCRKGFGVLAAVNTVQRYMAEVSCNNTRQAYVLKLDLSGFFMSIDKLILWEMLRDFIDQNYFGDDKDVLLYLVEVTVKHCPQDLCQKVGDLGLFAKLLDNKTLFKALKHIGMPIGNLTSQLFANFYMHRFDQWINLIVLAMGGRYIRFVDDILIVIDNPKAGVKLIPMIRKYLWENLHLKLNRNKFYLQPYWHGVAFLGNIVKPNRIYANNTLVDHAYKRLHEAERLCKKVLAKPHFEDIDALRIKMMMGSLNSFMGFMTHANTYAIRRGYLREYPQLWQISYYKKRCLCFAIKRKYRIHYTINNHKNDNRAYRKYRYRQKIRSATVHDMLSYQWQEREWRKFFQNHHNVTRNP